MASFDKRVGKSGKVSWRVRIRRTDGPAFVKSFAKKSDAEQWARTIEHKMDSGEVLTSSAARKHTLSDAIDRYLEVILPRAARNKNAPNQTRLLEWWRTQLGTRMLSSISSATIADVRDKLAAKQSRLGAPMSGGTINRHLAALSGLMKVAVKEFGWIPKNPVSNVSKMAESKGRERFLSDAERDRLLETCEGVGTAPCCPHSCAWRSLRAHAKAFARYDLQNSPRTGQLALSVTANCHSSSE